MTLEDDFQEESGEIFMTVKSLKDLLDNLPEEAGVFIKDENVLVPVTEIINNDISETDYQESYVIT